MNDVRHLRALQAYDAAATYGSLSKAAETLGVTHGAVSRQIKQLEQFLEVQLLHRSPVGIQKTEAGEKLHAATKQAFITLSSGIRDIRQQSDQQSITISLSTSLAIKWLVPKLPEFRDRYPGISVFLDANDDVIDFSERNIDVALRYGLPGWKGLFSERVGDEELVVVASPSLIGNIQLPMSPEAIADLPLLHDQFDPAWDRWAESVGLDCMFEHSNSVQFNNMALLIAAAIEGQGAMIARRILIEDDLKSNRLLRLDHTKVSIERALFLVCRNGDQERPGLRQFKDWVIATLKQ